jgi:sigma-B regulation protein RsbU (phosphoserine phosphatase)
MMETLAEIGREMASILDLDALLARIAGLTKRLVDYRTFGILLLNEESQELEMKIAVSYGDDAALKRVKLGQGLVGWAAQHKEAVLVDDVSTDPRYIPAVKDVRSELVVPMLVKDRCIGVFDLESPELSAFTKEHAELLTLLASQAAVAIENARLYEEVRRNEVRIEKELRFAQRVQAALLPTDLPTRLRGVDLAARFASARELGGDLHSAFAGELVRSRTFRRRYAPERFSVSGVLQSMNTILHERQLEEYYCTLCYALFDLKRHNVVLANSGLPYPVQCTADDCKQIELPGVPLGSFPGVTYDQVTLPLAIGDVFVFCSDGVFEAMNEQGLEFGARNLIDVVHEHRTNTARDIVDAIFEAVRVFRGEAAQNDDMTAVAVRITG